MLSCCLLISIKINFKKTFINTIRISDRVDLDQSLYILQGELKHNKHCLINQSLYGCLKIANH